MKRKRWATIDPALMPELQAYHKSMPEHIQEYLAARITIEPGLTSNTIWIRSTLWEKFFRDRQIKIHTLKIEYAPIKHL